MKKTKYNNNFKKLLVVCAMVMLLSNLSITIAATSTSSEWWSEAYDFFSGTDWKKDDGMLENLVDLIKLVGNAIFIIVAIVLGIKYMLGSADGKSDVKEGLVSLTVAMVFFYGWSALESLLMSGNNLVLINRSDKVTVGNIYSTAIYFLNIIAIGVVIYVGIKYLLSGAEGKADLKGRGVPFVVGMIMTFATITFLNFIREILIDVI